MPFIFGTWPDEVAEPIEREFAAVPAAADTTKMTLSGLLAIFFASNGVDAIRAAVTGAHRETEPRTFWKIRLLCVAVVLIDGALLIVSVAFTVALPLYFQFIESGAPSLDAQEFFSDPPALPLPPRF